MSPPPEVTERGRGECARGKEETGKKAEDLKSSLSTQSDSSLGTCSSLQFLSCQSAGAGSQEGESAQGGCAQKNDRSVIESRKQRDEESPARGKKNHSPPQGLARTKMLFQACRSSLACPKCDAAGTLVLNGTGGSGLMARCNSCQARTTGKKLAALVMDKGDPRPMEAGKRRRLTEEGEYMLVPTAEWRQMKETLRSLQRQVTELRSKVELGSQRDNPAGEISYRRPDASTDPKATEKRKGTEQAREQTGKKSWAQIVGTSEVPAQEAPKAMANKVAAARRSVASFRRPLYRAPRELESVYFGRIRRGPVGQLRKALRECLPSSAVVGISFIGSSLCEILTDARMKDRLVRTMKALGFSEEDSFDPYGDAMKKERVLKNQGDRRRLNLEACAARWNRAAQGTLHLDARKWYLGKAAEAERRKTVGSAGRPETPRAAPEKAPPGGESQVQGQETNPSGRPTSPEEDPRQVKPRHIIFEESEQEDCSMEITSVSGRSRE